MTQTVRQPPELTHDILKNLDDLKDYLTWAEAEIKNNVEIELEGLDDVIEKTCEMVKEAPAILKDEAEPKMTAMIEQLESLAETLREHPMFGG